MKKCLIMACLLISLLLIMPMASASIFDSIGNFLGITGKATSSCSFLIKTSASCFDPKNTIIPMSFSSSNCPAGNYVFKEVHEDWYMNQAFTFVPENGKWVEKNLDIGRDGRISFNVYLVTYTNFGLWKIPKETLIGTTPALNLMKTCAPQAACDDSDGGINYDVKGITKGIWIASGNYEEREDKCDSNLYDGRGLSENYCNNNSVWSMTYGCPNGCSDGACLSPTQTIVNINDVYIKQKVEIPPQSNVHATEGDEIKLDDFVLIPGRILQLRSIGSGASSTDKCSLVDAATDEKFDVTTGTSNQSSFAIDGQLYYLKVFQPGTNDDYVTLNYGDGANYENVGNEATTIEYIDSNSNMLHTIEGEHIKTFEYAPTLSKRILQLTKIGSGYSTSDFTEFVDVNTTETFRFDTGISNYSAGTIDGQLYYLKVFDVSTNDAYIMLTYGDGAGYENVGLAKTLFVVSEKEIVDAVEGEGIQQPSCYIQPGSGLFCDENFVEADATADTITLRISNTLADPIAITEVKISPTCGINFVDIDDANIDINSDRSITIPCAGLNAGNVQANMTFKYTIINPTGDYTEIATGSLVMTAVGDAENVICADSDGGIRWDVKGVIRGIYNGVQGEYIDSCQDNSIVLEYYCDYSNGPNISSAVQYCDNGCQNGACLNASEETARDGIGAYPAPFVEDGVADVRIIYGATSPAVYIDAASIISSDLATILFAEQGGELGEAALSDDDAYINEPQENLIILGSPAVNKIAEDITGISSQSEDEIASQMGYGERGALLKMYESPYNPNRIALLISGYSGEDTKAAAEYMISHASELNGLYEKILSGTVNQETNETIFWTGETAKETLAEKTKAKRTGKTSAVIQTIKEMPMSYWIGISIGAALIIIIAIVLAQRKAKEILARDW